MHDRDEHHGVEQQGRHQISHEHQQGRKRLRGIAAGQGIDEAVEEAIEREIFGDGEQNHRHPDQADHGAQMLHQKRVSIPNGRSDRNAPYQDPTALPGRP